MNRSEIQRQMRWLMTLRVVTITTLLCCAFAVEVLLRSESLRPLFLLSAAAYGMVLVHAVLDRWTRGGPVFVVLQLVGDAVLITGFLQITGGINSPMSFLYLLPISVAATVLYRKGGLAMAGVCWTLYAMLGLFGDVWTPFGSLIPVAVEIEKGRMLYLLVAHLMAMLAFALLSSYLSERLRAQGQELAERHQTVARLKALNENIIESINSGLITTDLGGRISFMNRGGAEIIGYGQVDVEGRHIESLLDLGEGFLKQARRRLVEKQRYRFECYFDTKQKRRIFLGVAVSNLHDKIGRPLGYIFIFQDLTEIHALEQDVRLKERMVALGEMAAGIAHELRNPLAAMSGAVQFLRGQLNPEGETLELMDIILRESVRLDQTIKDFLTFARPGRFSAQDSDLVKLIEDNLKLLCKSEAMGSRHTLRTDFAEEELICRMDPNRVKQVFWNLAGNALKAMPDGGSLTIELRAVNEGKEIEMVFADEGVGMTVDEQERYFQPFCSSFSEGTGLGAAIVYRLVQEHSGRIHVDSQPGNGTRVCVFLPREPGPAAELTTTYHRVAATGG